MSLAPRGLHVLLTSHILLAVADISVEESPVTWTQFGSDVCFSSACAPASGSCLFKFKAFAFMLILLMEETPCNYPATVPGDTCKSALRHPLLWCLPASWCSLGCQYRCKCCPADQYFLTAPLCSASHHLLGGYRGIQPLPASPLQPYRMQRWPFAVGEKVVWWEGGQRVFPAADWCCDPRESSKACEEYSWHLTQHPRLSFISPSYIYSPSSEHLCGAWYNRIWLMLKRTSLMQKNLLGFKSVGAFLFKLWVSCTKALHVLRAAALMKKCIGPKLQLKG